MTTRTTNPTWHDRRVLVAGGTAGFGLVLARLLNGHGIGIDRRQVQAAA
jgi:NADP-dependent 3-hydroxy acid dehydrogenase YdfG